MNNISFSKIFKLPINQRLRLVEDIWDSIAEHPEQIVLTDSQKEELDKRYTEYLKNPSEGKTWKNVKKILKSMNDK